MKKVIMSLSVIFCLVLMSTLAWAGSVTIPNVFSPNTPAKADSVNENFSAVDVAVDNNAAMITSLQGAHGSTRTSYVSVGAGAFTPFDANYGAFTRFAGISIRPANGLSTHYIAGVSLPHDALMTSFSVQFMDNDAGGVARAELREFCANVGQYIAEVSAIDSVGLAWYTDSSIISPDVDNTDCTYNIQIYLPTINIRFYKAFIEYQYTLD